MSDALSKFISGLSTLNPNDLGAAENKAAFAKFQGLDSGTQKAVLNDLTAAHGTTFDELNGLSDADKRRVTQNIKDGRGTFDGVTRQQQQTQPAQQPNAERPLTFNQKWAAASEARQNEHSDPRQAYNESHKDFAALHGEAAARNRHGYVNPEREAQLARQAAIRSEATRAGVSFGEMADKFVNEGR